ncbi:MAG: pantoate--beta-alanine ligase [Leptospirillia bacterium]
MRIARSLAELRTFLPAFRPTPLCLVPTMGALHEGHGALVDRGKAEGGSVAVSIFVNPLQFGPAEDLERYPRTPEQDIDFLEKRGADLVFLPKASEMIPPEASITVNPGPVGSLYCGASRPGHFEGVLTIVLKLFHLFTPEIAIFGEKDRQQLFLIGKMVQDLSLSVRVVGHPTVREGDGLALSSRNRYLSLDERKKAALFPRHLLETQQRWQDSPPQTVSEISAFQTALNTRLSQEGFVVDYLAFVDPGTFREISSPVPRQVLLLAAIFLGKTRLIDNIMIDTRDSRV